MRGGALALALLLAAALPALPAPVTALCRLGPGAPAHPADAAGWLGRVEPRLRERLEHDRVVFPPPGSLEPCSELVPALALFAHPPEVVFGLLVQTERHAEAISQLRGLRPLSRPPGPHVDRHEIAILFTHLVYHVEQHFGPAERRIWWNLSPRHANDIRALEGFWELHPVGAGRTLGVYGSRVDVGPAVPRRMQAALTRKNMQKALEALRSWVDEQGARAPEEAMR